MPERPGPPRVERNSPPRPPLVASSRRRQSSHDDLSGIQQDDAKEAALRAAATKLEQAETTRRALEVRAAQAEAERDRNAAEVGRLSVVAAPPAPRVALSEPPDSKAIRLQGKGWKVAIPAAALAVLAAPVTALVQHFVALDRSNADLSKAVATYEKRAETRDLELAEQAKRITELTIVVAKMSGFLESAFGKVGLNVKAEAGAQAVELKTDPQSASAAAAPKRQQVRVRTLIPAPAPASVKAR